MSLIFYSPISCHLKEGEYLGEIGKNLTFLESVERNALLEFLPISKNYYPISTTLQNSESLKIFKLNGDSYIIPIFEKKRNLYYKMLFQQSFNVYHKNLLVTVIQDGFYKFYLDGVINYIDELPSLINNVTQREYNNLLFLYFEGENNLLYVFNLNENKLLYKDIIVDFEIENTLNVKKRYNALIPLEIIESWSLENFTLVGKKTILNKSKFEIHPKLLPLAFFELISISADTSTLLSNNLKEREKDIREFIGKPIVILPYYKDISKTVIITNDDIKLYTLEFNNALIDNIIEE